MSEKITWRQCSVDEWVNFLAKFNCYGTEPEKNVLMHRHSITQEPLGQVVYGQPKTYFVNDTTSSPQMGGCSPCRRIRFRREDHHFNGTK